MDNLSRKIKRIPEILKCFFLRGCFHLKSGFTFWHSKPLPLNWTPRAVLLINWGGIGNFVLFSGVVYRLRQRFPKAIFVVLAREDTIANFLKGSGLVDEVLIGYPEKLKKENKFEDFCEKLKSFPFDLSLTAVGNLAVDASKAAWLSGAKFRVGENPKNRGYFYTHTIPVKPKMHEKKEILNSSKF